MDYSDGPILGGVHDPGKIGIGGYGFPHEKDHNSSISHCDSGNNARGKYNVERRGVMSLDDHGPQRESQRRQGTPRRGSLAREVRVHGAEYSVLRLSDFCVAQMLNSGGLLVQVHGTTERCKLQASNFGTSRYTRATYL